MVRSGDATSGQRSDPIARCQHSAQEHGFKAAVPCRDSGKPIPEGDEGRPLVAEMEAKKPRGA
jgi:hypothetical protein